MTATLPAIGSVPVSASGSRSFWETELVSILPAAWAASTVSPGGDLLDDAQDLDGLVPLVRAGVRAADVEEHQQGAEGSDDCRDDEQSFSAIHER